MYCNNVLCLKMNRWMGTHLRYLFCLMQKFSYLRVRLLITNKTNTDITWIYCICLQTMNKTISPVVHAPPSPIRSSMWNLIKIAITQASKTPGSYYCYLCLTAQLISEERLQRDTEVSEMQNKWAIWKRSWTINKVKRIKNMHKIMQIMTVSKR